MKSLLLFLLVVLFALPTFAQKDVTTFLGIPVDGTKAEVGRSLIEKGFSRTVVDEREFFEGGFNGNSVIVQIGTNNNKVCRIMVLDSHSMNEADIKIRFNNLVGQFEKNRRYKLPETDYRIGDDVDLSYEMRVNNKRFEAVFYQLANPEVVESRVNEMISKVLSVDSLNNLSESKKNFVDATYNYIETVQTLAKPVWFIIDEEYGKYRICIYYDNKYNQADGDDL